MQTFLGRGKRLQAGLTICCLMAFVLFGYEQGVFGGILENQDWLDHCYNLGCFGGCIVNYFTGERLGRRRTMWLAMAFVVVGTTLQTSALTVAHLVVGRVITGFGTGMKTPTVPMYQSELCDRQSRGRLVSAEVLFVGVGITTAYWFDFGMSFVGGPVAWRLPVAVQMLFALVVVVLICGLPESPRWLYKHGRSEEVLEVLCRVYDKDPADEYILAEKNAIIAAIQLEYLEEETSRSFMSIFRNDQLKTGYRVVLACCIHFMNQVGGINLVVYYAPSVLIQNVGISKQLAQILGGCINMMLMFRSIIPSLALDRMGRRRTMMAGCASISLCMLLMSILLSRSDTEQGHACSSAAVAFFFLYTLLFGMSAHCVPWVYLKLAVEFTVVMITPVITNRLLRKAYLIFFATNTVFVPALFFFYPETSNLRLEEVDHIFSHGGNPVAVAREVAKEQEQQEVI
ncbi:hypothetical protein BDV12DRAFT_189639 [Aspergillus spectabilis]